MPIYDITYVVSLSDHQKDSLATAITKIHTTKFPLTPALFVNVTFNDISQRTTYIGGKRQKANHIMARLRLGERKEEDFAEISNQLYAAWSEIVGTDGQLAVQSVVVQAGTFVGIEAGFELPKHGEEKAWVKQNWAEFKRRADAGDERLKELVKAVESNNFMSF